MYMTIIQADALGLYAGRSWAPGLLERASCFVIASISPFVIVRHSSAEAISLQFSSPSTGED